MFTRHITDFDTARAAMVAQPDANTLILSAETRLETPAGWVNAIDLTTGDSIARLDGGFARVTGHSHLALSGRGVRIPARVLGTCSDMVLPAEAHIGLAPPAEARIDAAFLSAPVSAMVGFQGITQAPFGHEGGIALTLEEEELIWAQTGMLLHAAPRDDSFYKRLDYGQTRAILHLMDRAHCGPDATVYSAT